MNESSAAAALGDLLEQMKRRSECSYVELARKTYTSRSTLHRYCAGRSVPSDAAVVTRLAMACGANQRELREALQAWVAADEERRQGPSGTVTEYSRGDAVRAAEPPAISRAVPPASRRRYRGIVLLMALAVLLVATTSASVFSPVGKDTARQQWITGPSWARAPMPVKSTFFGVTVASDLGEMPSFKTGAVRFWDSNTRWAAIQPRRGEFDWTTLDRLVAGANHSGLPALFVVGGTPGWAAPTARKAPYGDGSRAAAPDDMRDWRTFVRALVSRYRGRIEAYELWVLGNDPRFFNGPTETLVEMTRQADVIIKKTDPKATVVCPGMGQLWKAEGRRILKRFAELGGYQYCDIASIKLYQQSAADPPETMLKVLQVVDDVMRRASVGPPLWSTGTTYDIALQKRLGEQQSINYAVRDRPVRHRVEPSPDVLLLLGKHQDTPGAAGRGGRADPRGHRRRDPAALAGPRAHPGLRPRSALRPARQCVAVRVHRHRCRWHPSGAHSLDVHRDRRHGRASRCTDGSAP
jgi:hypothetical protein